MNDRANGASISTPCCRCSGPLVAHLGHGAMSDLSPRSGVKRTSAQRSDQSDVRPPPRR